MNELVLLESRSARQDRICDLDDDRALETINKAKALLMAMWQGTNISTTEQIADYYEAPLDTIQTVVKRNRKELESDGLKTLKGEALKEMFKLNICQEGAIALTIWTPRAALRLGMLLRDSLVAQQVRTVLLDAAEQQIPYSEFAQLKATVAKLAETTTPRPAFPRASVDPIPGEIAPMSERQCVNRLIRAYVYRVNEANPEAKRKTEQEITNWMYRELKYRHSYDVVARCKESESKSKIAQIEADGFLPQLHAICNHFLGN